MKKSLNYILTQKKKMIRSEDFINFVPENKKRVSLRSEDVQTKKLKLFPTFKSFLRQKNCQALYNKSLQVCNGDRNAIGGLGLLFNNVIF